jgi:hypothetical protein
MSERTIDNWITILDPLGYGQAADVILNDLRDFPKAGEHREEDKKQLGNATRRLGHADNKSDRERVGLGCGQAAPPVCRVLLRALDQVAVPRRWRGVKTLLLVGYVFNRFNVAFSRACRTRSRKSTTTIKRANFEGVGGVGRAQNPRAFPSPRPRTAAIIAITPAISMEMGGQTIRRPYPASPSSGMATSGLRYLYSVK